MKEIRCTWCQKEIIVSQVKMRRHKSEHGTVVERRCPHCNKVLAAYLDDSKGFLSRIRTF